MNSELTGNTSQKARAFRNWDYLKITILVFATTALWQAMHSIILPLRVLDFVPEDEKNTYLGLLISTGLILAMIIQPIVGAISDRSGFRWGRRRPFILVGVMALLLLLLGIGLAGSYVVLFTIYCLMQVSSNIAQGPHQGFIPDLVPEGKRGLASGVKGFLEVLGGVALLYFISAFMDKYADGLGSGWLWLSLLLPGILLLGLMATTLIMVKEQPGTGGLRLPAVTFNLNIRIYRSFLPSMTSRLAVFVKTHRSFLWFLASRLLFFLAMSIIQRFALYYLRDVIGVDDPAEAVFRFSILAVIGMLATVYPAGRLSDRIGRKPITIFSSLFGALGILIIILSQNHSVLSQDYSPMLIAAGILGVAVGAFSSTNWALATDLVTKGKEARYLGLANMATAGAGALAGFIGPLIDRYEIVSTGLGYQIMLILCLAFFLLGGLFILKIKASSNQSH